MTTPDYATDFHGWTQAQAQALRAKDWAALDLDHLAEEIADLGANIEHAIDSQLIRILFHLLKLRGDPGSRARRGWMVSVDDGRERMTRHLRRNPGLRHRPEERLPDAYRQARRRAALALGRPLTDFPEACPWSIAQVLDEDFFPEA